jgi:hypothetical protein
MYTLYFWNSGGEREEHGTHPTLELAQAEQAQMQADWGDDDSRFEILVYRLTD